MVFEDITSVNCEVISYGFCRTLRQSNVRLFPMVFESITSVKCKVISHGFLGAFYYE